MGEEIRERVAPRGPLCYELSKWASKNPQATDAAIEFPLFSDARFTGLPKIGPYHFYNTVAIRQRAGWLRPAVVLRVDTTDRDQGGDGGGPMVSDTTTYHGGRFQDELAALASISFGAVIVAGPANRRFQAGGDKRGQPIAWEIEPWPVLAGTFDRLVLPYAGGPFELSETGLELVAALPRLEVVTATKLVRAARLYQTAMFLAQSEPNISWLLLTSAVEAVASDDQLAPQEVIEAFRDEKLELATALEAAGGADLVARVAAEFKNVTGASKRFRRFLRDFFPDEPPIRPVGLGRLAPWDADALAGRIKLIYDYRSRALHDAKPFPYPICMPPIAEGLQNIAPFVEVPAIGLAIRTMGGTWRMDELPMHLHTFEYIVRGAIRNWCQTKVAPPQPAT